MKPALRKLLLPTLPKLLVSHPPKPSRLTAGEWVARGAGSPGAGEKPDQVTRWLAHMAFSEASESL